MQNDVCLHHLPVCAHCCLDAVLNSHLQQPRENYILTMFEMLHCTCCLCIHWLGRRKIIYLLCLKCFIALAACVFIGWAGTCTPLAFRTQLFMGAISIWTKMKQSGDEMYNVFAKLMLCWHLHSLLACLEPEFFFSSDG